MLPRLSLKSISPRAGGVALTLGAVAFSAFLVSNASQVAFQNTETDRVGDVVAVGPISLSNDSSLALFSSAGIAPGFSESHCITISSTSDIPTTVRMYSSNVLNSGSSKTLSESLNIQIMQGSESESENCTGFVPNSVEPDFDGSLKEFSAAKNYESGVGNSALAAGSSSQYKITVSLSEDSAIPQNSTTTAQFVWEAQG